MVFYSFTKDKYKMVSIKIISKIWVELKKKIYSLSQVLIVFAWAEKRFFVILPNIMASCEITILVKK